MYWFEASIAWLLAGLLTVTFTDHMARESLIEFKRERLRCLTWQAGLLRILTAQSVQNCLHKCAAFLGIGIHTAPSMCQRQKHHRTTLGHSTRERTSASHGKHQCSAPS